MINKNIKYYYSSCNFFLQKEIKSITIFNQNNTYFDYFLSFLSLLTQTIIYTFLISYILYNFMVIINPNPDPNNLLNEIDNIHSVSNVNFYNQTQILAGYYSFLHDIATLDFGYIKGTYDYRINKITISLLNTLIFLAAGLIISLFISLLLLIISNYKILQDTCINYICNISYFHIALLLIMFDFILVNFFQTDINSTSFIMKIIFSSIIISFGSGILVDYYNLLKDEHDSIIGKDYVVFAKDSGFKYYYFALKELLFNLISITMSRIPIIFGGLIIIEYYLKDSGMSGICSFILKSLKYGDTYSLFTGVFLCVLIFTFLHFFSQKIQQELLNN